MPLIILAQVLQTPPPPPPVITMLFPWLFMGTALGIILATMASRKGRSPVLWFILGFIPVVGFFAGMVLASRPDAALLQRIQALEDRLAKIPKGALPPELPSGLTNAK